MGRRYLIVKTSALGDVVQTLSVANFLKANDPDCTIDWVVERGASSLLKACPLLTDVIEVDTKSWRKHPFSSVTWKAFSTLRQQLQKHNYDIVFDLQGNTKSSLFTFLAHGVTKVGFDKNAVAEWPNLLVTNKRISPPTGLNICEDYLYIVSKALNKELPTALPPLPFIVDATDALTVDSLLQRAENPILLAPGSAWENKRLSKDQLVREINKLPPHSTLFLSWGSIEEHSLCESLLGHHPRAILLPKLSLPALHMLMSKMTLVMSMDSLPLHLAALAGVPTYSFFGPSSAEKYAPRGSQHRHIQGSCPYGKTFTKRCPILRTCPTGSCIKEIAG